MQNSVNIVTTFSKLTGDLRKENNFFDPLKTFTTETKKIFDIFFKIASQRGHLEVQYNLRMTDDIFFIKIRRLEGMLNVQKLWHHLKVLILSSHEDLTRHLHQDSHCKLLAAFQILKHKFMFFKPIKVKTKVPQEYV